MIERWDAIIYRNEEGSGAKIAKHPTGQFVKWKEHQLEVKKLQDCIDHLVGSIDEMNINEGIVPALSGHCSEEYDDD